MLQGVVAVLLLGDIHAASVHLGLLAEEVDSAVLPVEVDLHVGAVGGVVLALHEGLGELEGAEGAEHGAVVVVGHEHPALVGLPAVEAQHLLLGVKLQTEGLLGSAEGGVSAGADVDSHTLEGELLMAVGQGGGAVLVDVLGGDVPPVVGVDIQTGHRLCVGFGLGHRLGGQSHDLTGGVGLGSVGGLVGVGLGRLFGGLFARLFGRRVGGLLGGLLGGVVTRQSQLVSRGFGGIRRGRVGRLRRAFLRGTVGRIHAIAGGKEHPYRQHQHEAQQSREPRISFSQIKFHDFLVPFGGFGGSPPNGARPSRAVPQKWESAFTSTPQTAPAHP